MAAGKCLPHAQQMLGTEMPIELPDWVVERMALPEPVKKVQATSEVMFHWAKNGQNKNDLRGDTGTYQWECARAAISNPHRVIRRKTQTLQGGGKRHTFEIIGKVERPSPGYPSVQYVRLVLKYVPRVDSRSP